MSLLTKVLIFLGSVIIIGALAFIIFKQNEISQKQLDIESQVVLQKQLVDGIVRSQAQWTTKDDLNKFITDNNVNLKAIQDDLGKLHADVVADNAISVISNQQQANNLPSTNTGDNNPSLKPLVCKDGTPCPNADPFGYLQKQQNLLLNEDFGSLKIPFGIVGFSAWQDKPWNIDIKQREYSLNNVVGTDENQRLYFYNKFSVKIDGKNYDLPITTATTKQEYPEAKFSFWNPKLFIGINGEVGLNPIRGEFAPSLSVQIMSYGRYKTLSDFSILQIGAGYGVVSQRPQAMIVPVAYNIGKHIPLMSNTYLGPVISIGTDGNVFLGAGIAVGL